MKILIAPDSFKGSLTAPEAAQAIYEGLSESKLKAELVLFPIADGGEGSLEVFLNHKSGKTKTVIVEDPLGREVPGTYGLINHGHTAVVELAKASGIQRLPKEALNPLRTSTFGTGQLIAYALKQNVKEIILAVGGSATVDGGAGILQALGVKLLDASGNAIPKGGGGLSVLNSIHADDSLLNLGLTRITILCDVENPLLGKNGAAAVFGPQKGADAATVKILEAGLSHFNAIIKKQMGIDVGQVKHGGASGGVAAGLHGIFGARLVHGIHYLLDIANIDTILETTDVAITGEGKFDHQTIQGKGPWGLATRAKERGIPVIVLAGQVQGQITQKANAYLDAILPISTSDKNLQESLKNARVNLKATALGVGNMLAAGAG